MRAESENGAAGGCTGGPGCTAGGGEASCISQICRVIKLIKRLTHGGLLVPPPPAPPRPRQPSLSYLSARGHISLFLARGCHAREFRDRGSPTEGAEGRSDDERAARRGWEGVVWEREASIRASPGGKGREGRARERKTQPAAASSSPAHQIIVITEYYAAVSAAQTPWPINCGYFSLSHSTPGPSNMVNLNFQRGRVNVYYRARAHRRLTAGALLFLLFRLSLPGLLAATRTRSLDFLRRARAHTHALPSRAHVAAANLFISLRAGLVTPRAFRD